MANDGGSQAGWVYFVRCLVTDLIKIGHTTDTLASRLVTLQTGSAAELLMIGAIPGTMALEEKLHARFSPARVHHEWFELSRDLFAFICRNVPPYEPSVDGDVLLDTKLTLDAIDDAGLTRDEWLNQIESGRRPWPPGTDDPILPSDLRLRANP